MKLSSKNCSAVQRSRNKAIWCHCLECVGGVTHDVALCTGSQCPLWEWRFGGHYSMPANLKRVEVAWEKHPGAAKELEALGLDIEFYTNSTVAERNQFVERTADLSMRENVVSWRSAEPQQKVSDF